MQCRIKNVKYLVAISDDMLGTFTLNYVFPYVMLCHVMSDHEVQFAN